MAKKAIDERMQVDLETALSVYNENFNYARSVHPVKLVLEGVYIPAAYIAEEP